MKPLTRLLLIVFILLNYAFIFNKTESKRITNDILSLRDKKILVTAPSHYSARLAQFIEQANGNPILIPTIETICISGENGITQLLSEPKKYDYIVLPSRKAIQCFMEQAAALKIPNNTLKQFSLCAVGKDIDFLKEAYNLDVAIKPEEPSPRGITETLSKKKNIDRKSIAVVAPKVEGLTEPDVIPDFLNSLQSLGMQVEKVEGYITRSANSKNYQNELQQIRDGKIDLIAFTSTAEIEALIGMLGGVEILNKNTIACFGPYTAANAQKLGVQVDFTGQNFHSFEEYVKGIAEFLNHKKE